MVTGPCGAGRNLRAAAGNLGIVGQGEGADIGRDAAGVAAPVAGSGDLGAIVHRHARGCDIDIAASTAGLTIGEQPSARAGEDQARRIHVHRAALA